MKALVAALERIATALEQLVPALTQATREARRWSTWEDITADVKTGGFEWDDDEH